MRIKRRARKNKVVLEIKSITTAAESDPYSMFFFAMRSPKTREKCTGRLRMFFDFLDILPGQTMEERSMAFCDKAVMSDTSTRQEPQLYAFLDK
jgi:hypothetical protein